MISCICNQLSPVDGLIQKNIRDLVNKLLPKPYIDAAKLAKMDIDNLWFSPLAVFDKSLRGRSDVIVIIKSSDENHPLHGRQIWLAKGKYKGFVMCLASATELKLKAISESDITNCLSRRFTLPNTQEPASELAADAVAAALELEEVVVELPAKPAAAEAAKRTEEATELVKLQQRFEKLK